MCRHSRVSRRQGFGVIEATVIIAIIVLLIALLLPSVQPVRAAASRAQSVEGLHQLAIGMSDDADMAEEMADDTLEVLRKMFIQRTVDVPSLKKQKEGYDELAHKLTVLRDDLQKAYPTVTSKRDQKIVSQAIEAVENLSSAVKTVADLLGLLLSISSDQQPPQPGEMVLRALRIPPMN